MTSNVHPADALLALKAQMADLDILVEIERAKLIAMGYGSHDGDIARATVSLVTDRTKVNWEKIAQTLKPAFRLPRDKWSDQMRDLVEVNTKALDDYDRVNVVARIGKAA